MEAIENATGTRRNNSTTRMVKMTRASIMTAFNPYTLAGGVFDGAPEVGSSKASWIGALMAVMTDMK